MKKRLLICSLIAVLAFTIIATATAINGTFKDFPVVNILVNGKRIQTEVPAVNFYGKTVLPVRDIAERFNAIVEWDENTWTVDLINFHIDMIFAKDIAKDRNGNESIVNPFKLMPVGSKNSFYTYIQLDAVGKGKLTYRIAIIDPDGNVIHTTDNYVYMIQTDTIGNFDQIDHYENVPFNKEGIYKFQFQFKHNEKFKTVYEKELIIY